jgi:uncharacterized membrane protein (DUF2068 family)
LHQKSALLSWIVFLKVIKSLSLAALAVFLLGYLHRDPVELVVEWATKVNLPSTSTAFTYAISLAMGLTVRKQIALAATAFGYSVLLGIEAVGLTRRRAWARWFTIAITASLLPFEVYEILHRPGEPLRIATFIINVGIVIYLYKRKEAFEPPGH